MYKTAMNDLQEPIKADKPLDYTPMTHGVPDKIVPGYVRKSRGRQEPVLGPIILGVIAMVVGVVLGVGL